MIVLWPAREAKRLLVVSAGRVGFVLQKCRFIILQAMVGVVFDVAWADVLGFDKGHVRCGYMCDHTISAAPQSLHLTPRSLFQRSPAAVSRSWHS